MLRVRLKADGRIVEILPDGSERPLPRRLADIAQQMRGGPAASASAARNAARADAAYARGVRARTKLTQAEFATRIGVPLETVRNWEQGKRSPRGPARALLKLIEQVPDIAFAVLHPDGEQTSGQGGGAGGGAPNVDKIAG
jgi:putative transcriptional regulator